MLCDIRVLSLILFGDDLMTNTGTKWKADLELLHPHQSGSLLPEYFVLPNLGMRVCTSACLQGLYEQIHLPFSLFLRNYIQIKRVTTNFPVIPERENGNIPAISLLLPFCPEVWSVFFRLQPAFRRAPVLNIYQRPKYLRGDASGLVLPLFGWSW